jgi:hypothetical protein
VRSAIERSCFADRTNTSRTLYVVTITLVSKAGFSVSDPMCMMCME